MPSGLDGGTSFASPPNGHGWSCYTPDLCRGPEPNLERPDEVSGMMAHTEPRPYSILITDDDSGSRESLRNIVATSAISHGVDVDKFNAMFFATPRLHAQTAGTGALTGTVSDSSGAAIPNATVTLINNETGQERTAATGTDGVYRFALECIGAFEFRRVSHASASPLSKRLPRGFDPARSAARA